MLRSMAATRWCLMAFLVCALPATAQWNREAGWLFTQTFTPKTYQASPQNWAAVQDKRGVMFFGNTEGVLEYDGVTWRKISAGTGTATSLAVDDQGTVYVGSRGDFGFLAPDKTGNLHYVSLLSHVPAEARKFADVWSILPLGDSVYFGSYQAIFRWSPRQGSLRIWKPARAFGRLTLVNGVLYVASRDQGLQRLNGEIWDAVPGGEQFSPFEVRAVYAGSAGMELATRSALYRYDGKAFTKFSTPVDELLKSSMIAAVKVIE